MTVILSAEDLHVAYGAIRAIRGVSLQVRSGEVLAVLGANGAGKTTLLRALANELPRDGTITYKGRNTAGVLPYRLAADGLLHIPEGRGTFTTMTVDENLRLAFERMKTPARRSFDMGIGQVFERFPRLQGKRYELTDSLSGGEQQMLAMARVILAPPDLLLLDEPSLGLAPAMVETVFALVKDFRKSRISTIIVEQNAVASLALADRACIIRQGQVVLEGNAEEIAREPNLPNYYFGAQGRAGASTAASFARAGRDDAEVLR